MKKKLNLKSILKSAKRSPVDERFLKSLREQLIVYMEANPLYPAAEVPVARPANIPFGWHWRALPIPLVAVAMVVIFTTGTAFAAQGSLPGDILYPVKLATENVRVAGTADPAKKVALEIAYIRERVAEIHKVLADASSPTPQETITPALENLETNLAHVAKHTQDLREAGDIAHALEVNENARASLNVYEIILEEHGVAPATSAPLTELKKHVDEENAELHEEEDERATERGFEDIAKKKMQKAEKRLKEAQKRAEKAEKQKADGTLREDITKKLNKAKDTLKRSKEDLDRTDFEHSLERANESLDESSDADAWLQISPKAKKAPDSERERTKKNEREREENED